MARCAVTAEPRSPGRSICSPGGGFASPATALVMVAHHALAPCVKCASTSPTVQPVHALGRDHPSWPRRAMKSQSWDKPRHDIRYAGAKLRRQSPKISGSVGFDIKGVASSDTIILTSHWCNGSCDVVWARQKASFG